MAEQTPRGQRDARGVRKDSLTNRLRSQVRARPKKRHVPVLEPLKATEQQNQGVDGDSNGRSFSPSLQRQIQGPLTLQWLVDDFIKAAGTGDVQKVDRYIRGGIPIDRTHSVLQYNALHASAALPSEQVAKRLLQAGADFTATAQASDDDSALHMVARYGSLPVAQELLRSNVPMRLRNQDGATPMDLAADRQDHKMERLLEPPPNAPKGVRVVTVTSTSLRLAWSPDQTSNGGSVVPIRLSSYQYKVTWRLCGTVGEFTEVCKEASFHIFNLLPASEYEISVQAGNHTVGWSAASAPPTVIRTQGDVPNAMSAPIITAVGDAWIQMQIRLPQSNGSPITRLLIQTQCTGGIAHVTTSSFRHLLKPRDYEQRWEALLCDVALMPKCGHSNDSTTQFTSDADREYTATGLAPGHVYYFRVKACNQNGWSPEGEISDGICTNDCPKIVSAKDRSMILVWSKPYSTEHIDGYEIHARASSSTKWDALATQIPQHSLEVYGLIPATAYSFRIVPHFARSGWGDAERCVASPLVCTLAAAPDPPLEFVMVDRTEKSITLSWDMPRCNGHVVLNYSLEYRCDFSRSMTTSATHERTPDGWYIADHDVAVGLKTYTIEGLHLGTAYSFRVSARNAIGCGPCQELSELVWTYRFPPPSPPQCILKTNCSLHIEWAAPNTQLVGEANSDDLEYAYELQICQVDSVHALDHGFLSTMTWTIAASELFEPNASITGLSPLGCYCFRVRAFSANPSPAGFEDNASVFSPVSAVFQTLRRM